MDVLYLLGDREVIVFGDGTEIRKYLPELDQYSDIVVKEERIESIDFDFSSGLSLRFVVFWSDLFKFRDF